VDGLSPCLLLRSEAIALRAVERHVADSISALLPEVEQFVSWMDHCPQPAVAQERFALIRLRFNLFLDRFDVFADAITQRSEQPIGAWLAGLDAVAEDMLATGVPARMRPPLACYLDRGRGAAIRRVRTRFPDGELNPLALVRLPRERMIGSGVASSLAHEVGHQGVALLGLLEPVRRAFAATPLTAPWALWASEILADFWAIACLGISATVGLLAVVTLPQAFVFRMNDDDVHPSPYLRTLLSAELGARLFPDPQWHTLSATWRSLYPLGRAGGAEAALRTRAAEIPAIADTLVGLRFAALDASLADHLGASARNPHRLRSLFGSGLDAATPLRAIAALGQARADGAISPEAEARTQDELLSRWALHRSGLTRFIASSQGDHHGRHD
jgi:hypothetical protein